ncbi:hypothetical protein ACPXB5_11480 [Micromonospora arida]|uniref:hypothetical protein n=1 Tax=Micromonospora arida TaxID=2203715 RepID=UPI003CF41471
MVEQIAQTARQIVSISDALLAARYAGDTKALATLNRQHDAGNRALLRQVRTARRTGVSDDSIRAALVLARGY